MPRSGSKLGRKKIVSSVLDMLSLRCLLEKIKNKNIYIYIPTYIILYILFKSILF